MHPVGAIPCVGTEFLMDLQTLMATSSIYNADQSRFEYPSSVRLGDFLVYDRPLDSLSP